MCQSVQAVFSYASARGRSRQAVASRLGCAFVSSGEAEYVCGTRTFERRVRVRVCVRAVFAWLCASVAVRVYTAQCARG